ncbi:MAG: tetratricopeptide repeat protein [Flavobacteriales bacterium]|nr:tetratricopeptide repeat protein [Flavobacteriales bacterium]
MSKLQNPFNILLICLISLSASAQKTQVYEQGEEFYYQGVELFEKKLYGSATEQFKAFLKTGEPGEILTEQAECYILLNDLMLNHYRADYYLEEFVKAHPENGINTLALFHLANYYFADRKFKKAGRIYEELDVNNLPLEHREETWFKMGYSFLKLKEYDNSKKYLDKVRKHQGEYYVEANYYYGYICYVQNEYAQALASFERIKDKGPDIMNLYIAQIYYAQEAFDQAIQHSAKHFDEKYANEFNLVTGKSLFQQGKYAEASSYFKKIDRDFRLNDEEIYQFGFSSFHAKDYKAAVDWFVQISGSNSALGQLANYQLGQSFIQLKDKEQALAAFAVAKGMSHHPEIKETAHFNYAKLASELGRQDAIRTTQQFLEEFPNSKYKDPAKGMLAKMFLNTNNYTQAVQILDEIQQFDQATKEVYQKITYLRGEQLYADKDYSNSSALFTKSLRFKEDQLLVGQAYFWLGEIDFQTGNYDAATSNFNRFLSNTSSKKSRYKEIAYYNIGYGYYLQKQYSNALNYFKRYEKESSYSKDPQRYMDNALRLGDCNFLRTQYTAALEAYRTVSDKNGPKSDYAIYQQGIIYGLLRQGDKKIATLEKIQRSHPKSTYLDDALFEIGTTYLQDLNNPDKALELYNTLISKYDSSIHVPDAYVKMALIYYQKGIDEKAISYCKQVVERFPRTASSQEALTLLESIYVKSGRGAEYLDYIASIPNSNIRITYQDSLLYESAMRKYRQGDCPEATKGFDEYIKRFGKNGFFLTHAHYYKAECAYSKRNYETAQKHYAYVAAQPRNEFSEDANFKLAETYYAERRYDKALPYYSQLERIANSKDNYVTSLVGQMRCNYALNNLSAAKQNAVAILPIENISKEYLIEANLVLGKIHWTEGNMLSAEFSFDYVRKESTTEKGAEAQYYKCRILFDKNRMDACEEEIFALNDRFASYEYWVVRGFILLSDLYRSKQDYFNARATLKSILDFYEGDQSLIDECNKKLKEIDKLESGKKADPDDE